MSHSLKTRHPLRGYGMGDFLSDILSSAENAIKTGASSAAASAASSVLSQPDVARAASETGQRVAAEGLAQQLLAQKTALTAALAKNKVWLMVGAGALVAGLIGYKVLKK